jgi:flagellar hook-basal body protein
LSPAAAVASTNTTTLTQSSTAAAGTTTDSYTFASTGTVNQAGTSLTITEGANTVTIAPQAAGESTTAYAGDINSALSGVGITDVTASGTGGVLSLSGPTASAFTVTGTVKQDVAESTTNYSFVTSNGSLATVDPTSTLAITEGSIGPITAPAFTSGESVSSYASALQCALTGAGITDVTVTGNGGVLSITEPSNMSISGTAKQDFTGTSTSYTFGSYTDPTTGSTLQATVDPASTLTITGPTTSGGTATTALPTFSGSPETVADYATDLQSALTAAGITGVTVSANATTGKLSIVGPSTMTINGAASQDMTGTTNLYNFQTNATVDPGTNLTITGKTSSGTSVNITAPTVTSGETVAQYATALQSALTTAGIANVTVSSTGGQLSIVGANLSISGSVEQDLADTTVNYNFGSSATVNPATNLTITGPKAGGGTATITAPTVTSGETVAQYAAALNNALTTAGITTGTDGVTVTATGGQLSIVGPASTLSVAGTASQDLTASTISYDFGSSGGSLATVDPTTNLTITGLTSAGNSATITAPTVTSGETVAQYATALNSALETAGIGGVTVSSTGAGVLSITGANVSTSGNVVQDPVASANASGTLTFDASGNLVSPAANLSNVTFAGLSDGAAAMNMSWNLFGTSGTGTISQTDSASLQSAQTANGYASGAYNGTYTIGSDGTITADYSNGQNQTVGQIALATVSNLQGLADVGSTNYQTTAASGLASVGVAGTDGLGMIEGSSLEASNVDISTEFSDLIVAQRAFEANAKSVTTFDTVTEQAINMIH